MTEQNAYTFNFCTRRDKETFAERQMKARGKETFKDELREVIQIELSDPNNRTLEDVVHALMQHYHGKRQNMLSKKQIHLEGGSV